jgi:tripartite-type tricarboxylate transporter receptor subunit TctC
MRWMRMTGVKLLHVTYKGNAQAIVDVMGGQVAMMAGARCRGARA